jgi:indolepyruvate ferredoxin oxidoreductase alpha subunit
MELSRSFLSGDEAVAEAALAAGVMLGTGYPGTPSTEILEHFSKIGGRAQWAPNEKVALEVALGVAYADSRALVTMKHVGVNVAADALFSAAYTGVRGGLVLVSADDPGMASSQNEQDNRRYAVAAGVPMLEPADSQEAYDFTLAAFEISERWGLPVMLRMTTRVCHSLSIVRPRPRATLPPPKPPRFERAIRERVLIPANARPAHRRLRARLAEIDAWGEASGESAGLDARVAGSTDLGIITSGVSFMHVREAAPEASVLKLGLTYPLPLGLIREFAATVGRLVVIEEGDPCLADAIRAAGIAVESKAEMDRFGELNVARVRRILAGDLSPEPAPVPGKPPSLCPACPHRGVFETLKKLDCIVAGDIGCYTLGALPPLEAMDSCVCMGAAIGVGLGLRHALPPEEARRVVSVIGDSTFVHSGLTGLVEMAYNPPPTGHVLIIMDNGTTAMTGLQEHPGTGRRLNHEATTRWSYESVAEAIGIKRVHVCDPTLDVAGFESTLKECLASGELALIVTRRPCILATGKIRQHAGAAAEKAAGAACLANDGAAQAACGEGHEHHE